MLISHSAPIFFFQMLYSRLLPNSWCPPIQHSLELKTILSSFSSTWLGNCSIKHRVRAPNMLTSLFIHVFVYLLLFLFCLL
jgi:hypothetical protein